MFAQLTSQLFPVEGVDTIMVLLLFFVLKPFSKAVQVDEADRTYAFAWSDKGVTVIFVFIEANTTLTNF